MLLTNANLKKKNLTTFSLASWQRRTSEGFFFFLRLHKQAWRARIKSRDLRSVGSTDSGFKWRSFLFERQLKQGLKEAEISSRFL